MSGDAATLSVFFAYRDSALRRAALQAPVGAAERYCLFGLDQLASRGVAVRHNLEVEPPAWASALDGAANRLLYGLGGYGGDFASVFPFLGAANRADVVLSTVDTVGIPLALLARAGLLRSPLVYVAVGLPERLERLSGEGMRRLYASALGRAYAIVSYSAYEAEALRRALGHTRVVFLPFGVDTEALRPSFGVLADTDVVSIGADPRRDYPLLLRVAARRPEISFRLVVSAEHARALGSPPANVAVEVDLPLAAALDRARKARLVCLPVRENSYSGATTTLLQAMSMAKPVVVSRTVAIASGYDLEDGVNCRLVAPGDETALERAMVELLADPEGAARLGARARETAERSLSWDRYADALLELLQEAAGARGGR
ncbi:MAG: hypothetical protein C4305_01260 [Thermoleophilia bacterium]